MRSVLRGSSAAQAVPYTPDALADLPRYVEPVASPEPPSGYGEDAVESVFGSVAEAGASAGAGEPARAGSGGRVHFDEVYAEQMAALREEARRDGFAAGHAEGMLAAEQAVAEMVAAAQERVCAEQDAWRMQAQATLSALAAAVEAFDARTAPELAEMTDSLAAAAYTLVEDLFARELAVASEPGVDAVSRALRLVPVDQPAVVRLNPTDHGALDPEWTAALSARVTLVADASVEGAGAVAEAGARRVDAQLSTALERVREALDQ